MSVAQLITDKITLALSPSHIEVVNESHNHHVPANSETHFKLIVVSSEFEGKRLLARHRMVNTTLSEEFENGLHALTMHTYTPEDWSKLGVVPESPKCTG